MNILVTADVNYMKPLKVMLKSLFLNNANESFVIYLMHSGIVQEELDRLDQFIAQHDSQLEAIYVEGHHFKEAPTPFYFTQEMYYRLLACQFLPESLEKILYVDPDVLVLNPVKAIYQLDLQDNLYAAAYHDKISVKEINRIRLMPYDIDYYFNSGILLLNLQRQREMIDSQTIFNFVEENRSRLIMPDQDILNALYSKQIKSLDETIFNYDARYYNYYKFKSNGKCDMHFVIHRTVFLHFCGKKKPWEKKYSGIFHALYKHYEKLTFA